MDDTKEFIYLVFVPIITGGFYEKIVNGTGSSISPDNNVLRITTYGGRTVAVFLEWSFFEVKDRWYTESNANEEPE